MSPFPLALGPDTAMLSRKKRRHLLKNQKFLAAATKFPAAAVQTHTQQREASTWRGNEHTTPTTPKFATFLVGQCGIGNSMEDGGMGGQGHDREMGQMNWDFSLAAFMKLI